jgi:hypothetical protein
MQTVPLTVVEMEEDYHNSYAKLKEKSDKKMPKFKEILRDIVEGPEEFRHAKLDTSTVQTLTGFWSEAFHSLGVTMMIVTPRLQPQDLKPTILMPAQSTIDKFGKTLNFDENDAIMSDMVAITFGFAPRPLKKGSVYQCQSGNFDMQVGERDDELYFIASENKAKIRIVSQKVQRLGDVDVNIVTIAGLLCTGYQAEQLKK